LDALDFDAASRWLGRDGFLDPLFHRLTVTKRVVRFVLHFRVSTTTPGGTAIFDGEARGEGAFEVGAVAGLVAEDDGLIDWDAVDA
jgi:hypothetical protein